MGNLSNRPVPTIDLLHFVFLHDYLDDLVADCGVFLCTERFRDALEGLNPSGVEFTRDHLIVETEEEQFERLYPHLIEDARQYLWLKVTGVAGEDDFGVSDMWDLVVSDMVWYAVKDLHLHSSDVTQWADAESLED